MMMIIIMVPKSTLIRLSQGTHAVFISTLYRSSNGV